jgi:hypothetical protein
VSATTNIKDSTLEKCYLTKQRNEENMAWLVNRRKKILLAVRPCKFVQFHKWSNPTCECAEISIQLINLEWVRD